MLRRRVTTANRPPFSHHVGTHCVRWFMQVSYKFTGKPGQGGPNTTHTTDSALFGFIAQDVQKLFPELVTVDEDGWLAIRYTAFTPLIVELLKEHEGELLRLKNERIAELERRLEASEDRIARLEAVLFH